jgi:hypothetical protein
MESVTVLSFLRKPRFMVHHVDIGVSVIPSATFDTINVGYELDDRGF